jgi:hypothetical protein
MSRLAAMAAMILFGVVGIHSAAYAQVNNRELCDFTVTAAGNGVSIMSPNFTPVGTLQTGQVFGLINTRTTNNGILYWQGGFSAPISWYPIKDIASGVVYLAEDINSCGGITPGQ